MVNRLVGFALVLVAVGVASPALAVEQDDGETKPPWRKERMEIYAFHAASIAGYAAAAGLVNELDMDEDRVFGAGLLGYGLAGSAAFYGVGTSGDETGSYLATLGGTAVGMLPGIALGYAGMSMSGFDGVGLVLLSIPLMMAGASTGAVLGFNLSRGYEPGRSPAELRAADRRASRDEGGFTLRPTAIVTAELSTFGATGTF